jgi:hypothetical protein
MVLKLRFPALAEKALSFGIGKKSHFAVLGRSIGDAAAGRRPHG